MSEQQKLEKWMIFCKSWKVVVRIVLYRLAISQSDYRNTGHYQLPYDKNMDKSVDEH